MTVQMEARGSVCVITIHRPSKRNAFDASTTAALDSALNTFEDDSSFNVAVLTGGPDFFSAGTDILVSAGSPTARGGPYGIASRRLNKPLVAAVEGFAVGGGFEIVLAATLVVASRTAIFSFPEVGLGLVPECGGLFRGPRALPLNIARELLLTGDPLTAQRAHELGLVNRLVEPGRSLAEAIVLAEQVSGRAPIAIRESLRVIDELYAQEDREAWASTDLAKQRVRSSADAVEGVEAFFGKRPPRWAGQ